MTPARLILEDSTVYEGESFGSTADTIGEVVFNTSLTGYQEIATDPSYRFQIVTMTYPHIGNYGIEHDVEQSEAPQVAGFVVRDAIETPSNAHSQMSLAEYFERNRISAIQGIDTRALTRKIRSEGAMRGMITSDASRSVEDAVAEVRRAPSMSGLDLVQRVTALRAYPFDEHPAEAKKRIAVYDFGCKRDILRHLTQVGCEVTVYPATTHAEEILSTKPDGVLLSNGPGAASGWYCTASRGSRRWRKPSRVWSLRLTCVYSTSFWLSESGSTAKPWFCAVISTRPLRRSFTG